MHDVFVPCPGCTRHVRATVETHCPFCTMPLPSGLASRAAPFTTQRLSRAAMLALVASVAATGCASAVDPAQDAANPTDSARTDTVTPADHPLGGTVYGAPTPQDAGH